MSDPRAGETWSPRSALAEGVIVDAHVHAIQERFTSRGEWAGDEVVFTWHGSDRQHTCPMAEFKKLYVRRVAIAGELRRIVRELRRLAEGDVSLRALADEIDAQADHLTAGLL